MNVLLTGSNGYIGRRLKKRLLEQKEINLKLLVRNPKSIDEETKKRAKVIKGDSFNLEALSLALENVEVAYYLIHSLQNKNYRELDKLSAKNFVEVAKKQGVKKIIYLGGLGVKEKSSTHLLSRIETGEVLSSENEIKTIWIRAGVIIGSGSASFEIMRHLIQKLPIMVTPKWVTTLAQPIGVDDVISYLDSSKNLEIDKSVIVDIGSEKMSYKKMMIEGAKALGLKRVVFPLPILTIKLSSYWLNLFTPVPYNVANSLIEGLSSEVVIQNSNAKKYFPQIEPLTFKESVKRAIKEMEENQVYSRWSDAGGDIFKDDIARAIFLDRQILSIEEIEPKKVYETICSIGGDNGWFGYNWLWEIRGVIDKMIGGAGINRGRRDTKKLRVGESLDFWRVEDLIENERLLLKAQMIVPGKAWLEFKIKNKELIQTAYFYPKGIFGRLYWYSLIPLHFLVFRNMIKEIVKKSKTK